MQYEDMCSIAKKFFGVCLLSGDIGDTLRRTGRKVTLQSGDNFGHGLNNLMIFAVALVTPTPSRIPADLL